MIEGRNSGKAKSSRRWVHLAVAVAIFGALLYIGLGNVSKPGAHVVGCLQTCGGEFAKTESGILKVMSLNMLHGYPDFNHLQERLSMIAGEIQRQDADIVLLQETPWRPDSGYAAGHLARQTGMNYAYLRANGNRWIIRFEEGVAVLSRYPILSTDSSELKPRNGFFENRVVLHAVIDTPQGRLDVFVTHLTHADAKVNASQAEDLTRFVEEHRVGSAIIAGDFNAKEESPQIQALSQLWLDAYRQANPGELGPTCCLTDLYSGSAADLDARIDYIFLAPSESQGFDLVRVQRVFDYPYSVNQGWMWASDHAGLLAILELQSSK